MPAAPGADSEVAGRTVPASQEFSFDRSCVLRRTAGWQWAYSRPMVGDVNADGWDDLVVRHRYGSTRSALWVFLSTGSTLSAPVLWQTEPLLPGGFDSSRSVIGDCDADGGFDLITVRRTAGRASPTPGEC
jgi:FG-GAP-like repeat